MSNASDFIKEQVEGWVGNLMRDLDAQGTPVTTHDVATALEQVAYAIHNAPTMQELNEFLKEISEERKWE